MCVVSWIGDGWQRQLPDKFPGINTTTWSPGHFTLGPEVSREDIENLKKGM